MSFKAARKELTYIQQNDGNINDVFFLLCPVREKDWLDGWDYQMIYSKSGLIEKDCVFTTLNENGKKTVWQVTQYDEKKFNIEFLRVIPDTHIVKINISLEKINNHKTKTKITYKYTSLNKDESKFIENQLEKEFQHLMFWWEKSINHYLITGKKLKKTMANKSNRYTRPNKSK